MVEDDTEFFRHKLGTLLLIQGKKQFGSFTWRTGRRNEGAKIKKNMVEFSCRVAQWVIDSKVALKT